MRFLPAILLLAGTAAAETAPEMRGIWVVRTGLTSPEAVDRVVEQAQRGGFNALFVQVRGRGDAFYASALSPRSELLRGQPADFDPLRRLLQRAGERRLAVHAWINVLLAAGFTQPLPPGHVLLRHPQWAMVPAAEARRALSTRPDRLLSLIRDSGGRGEAEGFYLSPSVPGAAEHIEQVVRELVRGYPVAGLHLDFIRYPGAEYDWSRPALEQFRRRQRGRELLTAPAREPEAWTAYRREVLTALVERLARVARAQRPALTLSAAVVPDEAQAVQHRFQAWPTWYARGLLDAVCPMAYTADSRVFRSQVSGARSILGAGPPLWAGVGAYRLGLDAILERIQTARELGAGGVVLFSHESLDPRDLDQLRQRGFEAASDAAWRPADTGSGSR